MSLKFKKEISHKIMKVDEQFTQKQISYKPVLATLPGIGLGMPRGGIPQPTLAQPTIFKTPLAPIPIPGENLSRAINYYADYGGCGFWRMYWPEHYLNANQKALVNGISTMILEPRFYSDLKAVKLQRQATPVQLQFMKFLKAASQEFGFKIIYEIDDIVFRDDIPDYNRCKVAFVNPEIVESIMAMMQIADEITVTCKSMRDYYVEKTGNKNVTIIPNYAPRAWIDRYYNPERILELFDKNSKRPRIGYCGSGTHIDQLNKTGMKDDFEFVIDHIISTRSKYKWVFFGCHPLQVMPFIKSGEMEFYGWEKIYDFPRKINDLELQAVIAPLQNNVFNCAKSNIKYLEAAYLGIPGVFQDLPPYEMTPLRFTTGDEMLDQLNVLLEDYEDYSLKARKYADTMFLDDEPNLMKHYEVYFTPYGSSDRKYLLESNENNTTK